MKRKWFDLIASGKKKTEYREIKEYWSKRFITDVDCNRVDRIKFDEVHFRNGYSKSSPFMCVEWKGLDQEQFNGELHWAIRLGEILELNLNKQRYEKN